MGVGASFVADDEAPEVIDPREAALDDPGMLAELFAALHTSPCNSVLDAPATARLATSSSVVGLVGVQLAGPVLAEARTDVGTGVLRPSSTG